jgi:predicted phage terminase large subunit-like protein
LFKLMKWKWTYGSKAFNTEYMNNPIDEESMIFNPETFAYYENKDFPHAGYAISMGIDFALGKERGDYSAITVVARDKNSGTKYVIDSFVERLLPDKFIEKIVEKVLEHQPDIIAAEAQAAQEFFVDTLKVRLQNAGYPAHTRVKKIHQRSRKQLRIETMLPEIENRGIQFNRRHSLLLEQFERYGQGGHDDAIDSLEMAISAAKENTATIRTVRMQSRR